MMKPGPSIKNLMRRAAEVKSIFLSEPEMKGTEKDNNTVNIKAVVSDALFLSTGRFIRDEEAAFFDLENNRLNRNYLGVVLLLCNVLADEWFKENRLIPENVIALLTSDDLKELSKIVSYELFYEDQERREELIRLALKILGLIPGGETEARANDRLNTLDSVERKRIISKTQEAQKRAQELREALAKKAAEEAASKMYRE